MPNAAHSSVSPEQQAAAKAWLERHPWRGACRSLGAVFNTEAAEPYTKLWHAIRVLKYREDVKKLFQASQADAHHGGLKPDEVAGVLKDVMEFSFAAGLSADAMAKKPFEHTLVDYEALKKKRAKASGRRSATSREQRVASLMEALGGIVR